MEPDEEALGPVVKLVKAIPVVLLLVTWRHKVTPRPVHFDGDASLKEWFYWGVGELLQWDNDSVMLGSGSVTRITDNRVHYSGATTPIHRTGSGGVVN